MNSSKPILFIDTSYVTFYRYFATIFWYKVSHKKETIPKDYDWFQNKEFMEKFSSMYMKSFDKVLKKYQIPYENIIFAKDCPRKQIWRIDHFPEYKANRDATYNDPNWKGGPVFKYAHRELLYTLQKKYKFTIIEYPRAEADDVVAILKTHIRKQEPDRQIVIITNDHDYLQLLDEHTILINLKNKLLSEKSLGSRDKDLYMKIILGDSADNIPKSIPRCGKKTALTLVNNLEELQKKLENQAIFEQFSLNQMLIDFTYIPKNIQENVLTIYSKL